MNEISVIIFSIFGLIGLGYLAARIGLLSAGVGGALAEFVFTIAIPVLLFRTLSNADFSGVSPWGVWLSYFGAVAVSWTVSHLTLRRLFGRDARSGVVAGVSASFANTVLIAVPLVQTVVGDRGMVGLLIILSIHLPVMMLASTLLYEWALRADGRVTQKVSTQALIRHFAVTLAKNPIIIGIVAGALWRLTGLSLAAVPARLVDSLAQVAGPLALFSSGMSLARYGIARNVPQALVITVFKLALMPAVVLLIGRLVGLPAPLLAAALITAACPTGVNAYLIANRFGTGQAISSNAIMISTALGVVTVTLWLTTVL